MKDERIVEAFDSVDVDDASRQRMLDSLLAERERMVAQSTKESVSPGEKNSRGTDDSPSPSDARRHGVTPTHTVLLRIAACLLVAVGIGAVVLPMTSGSSSSSMSSSASAPCARAMRMHAASPSSRSGSSGSEGVSRQTFNQPAAIADRTAA